MSGPKHHDIGGVLECSNCIVAVPRHLLGQVRIRLRVSVPGQVGEFVRPIVPPGITDLVALTGIELAGVNMTLDPPESRRTRCAVRARSFGLTRMDTTCPQLVMQWLGFLLDNPKAVLGDVHVADGQLRGYLGRAPLRRDGCLP
jgi:hypothetical protein